MPIRKVLQFAMFICLIVGTLSLNSQQIAAQTTDLTPEATEATAVVVDSTPSGSPLTLVWQLGGTPDNTILSPSGLTVDAQGNVYAIDNLGKYAIKKFDVNGNFVAAFGTFGSGEGQFEQPQQITLDAAGNLYVTDFQNIRVVKLDSTGKFLTQWATEPPSGPTGMAVNAKGNIYVVNHRTHDHYLEQFDSNGQLLAEWGSTGSGDGQIMAGSHSGPEMLALDQTGNVYVADAANNRIEKFDSNGKFLSVFGTQGFHGNGQFSNPWGIGLDAQGNIYIADNNYFQKLDPSGNFLAQWSDTSGALQQGPGGMMVDAQGNIYAYAYADVVLSTTQRTAHFVVLKKFSQS